MIKITILKGDYKSEKILTNGKSLPYLRKLIRFYRIINNDEKVVVLIEKFKYVKVNSSCGNNC